MKNTFHIPIYKKENDDFSVIGEEVYEITYLHGKRLKLRIVVNEYLTKQNIDLANYGISYKNQILKAISEYKNTKNKGKNIVKNHLSLNSLNCYSDSIKKNVVNYLLPINKETNRDTLTAFKIVTIEEKKKKYNLLLKILRIIFMQHPDR